MAFILCACLKGLIHIISITLFCIVIFVLKGLFFYNNKRGSIHSEPLPLIQHSLSYKVRVCTVKHGKVFSIVTSFFSLFKIYLLLSFFRMLTCDVIKQLLKNVLYQTYFWYSSVAKVYECCKQNLDESLKCFQNQFSMTPLNHKISRKLNLSVHISYLLSICQENLMEQLSAKSIF